MPTYVQLSPGDPAPWFTIRSCANPRFSFSTAGGRYVVLRFFASAAAPHSQAALTAVQKRADIFNDERASFFGVSLDPSDEDEKRVADRYPGYRYFWDFDGVVSRHFGALPQGAEPGGTRAAIRRFWIVLDPTLRVLSVIPFAKDKADIAQVMESVGALPPPAQFAGFAVQAPILVLPNVFERAFCDALIGRYEAHGGMESGFMREVDGKTVPVHDPNHKRRKDHVIEEHDLIRAIQARFLRRVAPMIHRAYQFKATRMERYIVSCYAAEDEGHFRAHRDNTTKGTAHRRFAVSVNLNDDFDGGEVSFPEYGPRSYKAPVGGAVVFSYSLLHAVSTATRGRRYAFLPFLYDEEAARVREANAGFVDATGGLGALPDPASKA